MPDNYRQGEGNDVTFLHQSRHNEEYIYSGNIMLMKWSQMSLKKFIDYFKTQWLTTPFYLWQLCLLLFLLCVLEFESRQ